MNPVTNPIGQPTALLNSKGAAINYHDLSALGDLRAESDSPEAIRKVAEQFESLFINMVMKAARDAVPEGGLFDDSSLKMYEQMYDQQIAIAVSEQGGLGIADMVEAQLTRQRVLGGASDA
ncbi:MAG: rod-binding protein [Pseudomonadota bacterium]